MPTLRFKNSSSTGNVPSSLAAGELAVNWVDQKAWIGNSSGTPIKIIGSMANQEASSVNITGGGISVSTFGTNTPTTATVGTVTLSGTAMTTVRGTNGNTDTTNPMHGAGAYYEGNKLRGRLKNVLTFAGSGTYTYTKTGSDVNRVHVICVGAGGGARAYSECGGAGGMSEGVFDATAFSTVTVTVGGGGGGGVYFGFSGQGGTSSFGSYCSASGGYGSSNNESHSGGHGGLGYGGSINTYGGMGASHTNDDQYSPNNSSEGLGGASYFGGGMMADRPDFANGNPGVGAYGAGGVAVSPSHNGQGGRNGFDGCVIVYEYV